ncbi:MAG: hypothetical protein ACYCXU_08155 [Thermoleophilia bacterium]
MKNKHRLLIVAALAAVLMLVVGIGLALAQSGGTSTQPAPGQPQGRGPGFRGRARGCMMGGSVTRVENNTITLKAAAGGEKTVKVDEATRYVRPGGKATLADVKPGERVRILLKQPASSGNLTARVVRIGKPGARRKAMVGNITSINGNTVTIHTANGDKQFTAPQLQQGERVGVITGPDGSVTGIIYNPPHKPAASPAGGQRRSGPSGTGQTQTQTNGQTQTGGQGA